MKKLSILTIAVVALISTGAFAKPSFIDDDNSQYVSGKIGLSRFQDLPEKTDSFAFQLAWGTWEDVSESITLRGELEYSNQGYEVSNTSDTWAPYNTWTKIRVNQSVNTFLANGYIDFMKNYKVQPYVGASVGSAITAIMTHSDIKVLVNGGPDWTRTKGTTGKVDMYLAYGVGGGVAIKITKSLKADAGVRMIFIDDTDFRFLNASLGLRYNF
ncbi:MAG: outer membrane beta-barrel protein [Rickettsiales bacterium]|jgi:opacity protein-like surface antigen|nr:outer membrane beta-barrel protein [Rickettsiales bacterium]